MVISLISSNRDNTDVCTIENSIEQLMTAKKGTDVRTYVNQSYLIIDLGIFRKRSSCIVSKVIQLSIPCNYAIQHYLTSRDIYKNQIF